ncbi:inorganic triphosphatase [Motiliproteus sediminis]|uniref:CYTH domain-containing protein n=1 Tax=Motiliproteus sediminis TaxID=1468178 RepID=UPI001AEFB31A|nr:CYTH domain-containing protein [Motiliproteus sediminis]
MAAEIELKLSLPRDPANALARHPLIERHQQAAPRRQALYNRYFDTPDQDLNHHAIALRIRRQGQTYIQTLKTRGSSQGGLHQRQEWEWPLPSDQLDLKLLPAEAFPATINTALLAAAFTTDFQRTSWILNYAAAGKQALIELVLDDGWVSNGSQRDPIYEVELELKQGDAGTLISFARALAATLPLRICRISKAERGYRLAAPERARQLPTVPTPATDSSIEQAFYLLLEARLERLQSAIEGYEFLADDSMLPALAEELSQLLTLLDCHADAATAAELVSPLADLERELRRLLAPLLLNRYQGAAIRERQQAKLGAELESWLNSQALGQQLLALSDLLHRRPWNQPVEPFFDPQP